MDTLTIECLSCGAARTVKVDCPHLRDECPRCGYLGWAESESLSEALRRRLRDRPLQVRGLLRVAA